MGNPNTNTNPGGGNPSGGTLDLSSLQSAINAIVSILKGVFGLGSSSPNVITVTVGNTVGVLLAQNSILVKRAIIQNLSNTDTITVLAIGGNVKVANITAGTGIVLNPSTTAGQAGGSLPVGNVDLAAFTVISSTNTGQTVAVYYEQ